MRRANSTGTVYKMSGKRRKPWTAVITTGFELRDGKAVQKRHSLGSFVSKKEAQLALSRYIADPYDTEWTFSEVYACWKDTKDLTNSSMTAYKRSYERFSVIHDKLFAELKTSELERIIESCDTSQKNKAHMKLLLSQMYKYAMKHDITQYNLAERLSYNQPKPKIDRQPFTDDEIQRLWQDRSEESEIALIMIYTGVRIGELLTMEIDRENWLLKGGSKTEAGRNRIVPVREKIRPLMDFSQDENYDAFYQRNLYFLKKMGHTPHDCRVTFATRYKNADPIAVKLIMGHAIKDITKGVYTKYTPEELRKVIESVDY